MCVCVCAEARNWVGHSTCVLLLCIIIHWWPNYDCSGTGTATCICMNGLRRSILRFSTRQQPTCHRTANTHKNYFPIWFIWMVADAVSVFRWVSIGLNVSESNRFEAGAEKEKIETRTRATTESKRDRCGLDSIAHSNMCSAHLVVISEIAIVVVVVVGVCVRR